MVFPVKPPDMTVDSAAQYKANIDTSIRGMSDVVSAFAPMQNDPASMSIIINKGHVYDGANIGPFEVTGIPVAVTGQRIDAFYLDMNQRTVTRVQGVESSGPLVAPVAPALPAGRLPLCRVLLTPSDTWIANSMITDIRPLYDGGLIYAEQGFTFITDTDGVYRIALSGSYDKQVRIRMHASDGTSKVQFRNSNDAVVCELSDTGNLKVKGSVTPNATF